MDRMGKNLEGPVSLDSLTLDPGIQRFIESQKEHIQDPKFNNEAAPYARPEGFVVMHSARYPKCHDVRVEAVIKKDLTGRTYGLTVTLRYGYNEIVMVIPENELGPGTRTLWKSKKK